MCALLTDKKKAKRGPLTLEVNLAVFILPHYLAINIIKHLNIDLEEKCPEKAQVPKRAEDIMKAFPSSRFIHRRIEPSKVQRR
jgi:hypothetical protein